MFQTATNTPVGFIVRLKQRDPKAFSQLYDEYAPLMLGIIMKQVDDKITGEEILQEVFVDLWKQIENYDADTNRFFTWVLLTTVKCCKGHLTKQPGRRNNSIIDRLYLMGCNLQEVSKQLNMSYDKLKANYRAELQQLRRQYVTANL
jgi:Sigma-70 region 2